MTHDTKTPNKATSEALPFDASSWTQGIRVTMATFARMCNVSKQSVSQWRQDGKFELGPDGLLDPVKAAKQVIARSDPARLRARVFKVASEDAAALRLRVGKLEYELAELQALLDASEEQRRFDMRVEQEFFAALYAIPAEQRANVDADDWISLLDDLFDAAVSLADTLADDV